MSSGSYAFEAVVDGRPSWDFPRSASMTQVMVSVGGERGWSPQECLVGSGISPTELDHGDLVIDATQELHVVRNLVRLSGDQPGLGACVGTRLTLGMLGIWGMAMVTAATSREMVDVSHRYGRLSWLFLRPRKEGAAGSLRVVYDDNDVPADVRPFLIERDMASSLSIVPAMFGPLPVRATSTLTGERGTALATAMRGWDIELDNSVNSILVAPEQIDAPLPNADRYALDTCERYCQDLADQRSSRITTIMRSLLRGRAERMPSLAEIAVERHVDQRTLRRQLASEGTSYRLLVDEVRLQCAVEWLAWEGLTVEQVATLLSFSDARSFTKAFQRWTGKTPSAIRRSG